MFVCVSFGGGRRMQKKRAKKKEKRELRERRTPKDTPFLAGHVERDPSPPRCVIFGGARFPPPQRPPPLIGEPVYIDIEDLVAARPKLLPVDQFPPLPMPEDSLAAQFARRYPNSSKFIHVFTNFESESYHRMLHTMIHYM
jgi:hypothetical protein